MTRPRAVALGVHIVDILGRPVTSIPPGQGRALLDEIRVTAAGTAAGTAVDLARLGVDVVSMGALGDDGLADLLVAVLTGHGVDASRLARKPGIQTSATILPIRPNGERPALHCPGATSHLEAGDVDLDVVTGVDLLHVGGPDVLGRFGGEPLAGIMAAARGAGVLTTLDVLGPGDTTTWTRLCRLLPFVDAFCPNADQLRRLTGRDVLADAAAAAVDAGAGCVLVSDGADGALLHDGVVTRALPAFDVPVVDTTGCGDAVTAGFAVGRLAGLDAPDAAWLGMAAAGLVVQGLGSDAGLRDLAGLLDLLALHAPEEVAVRLRAALDS